MHQYLPPLPLETGRSIRLDMARGTAFLCRTLPKEGEKIVLLFGYFGQVATGALKKVLVGLDERGGVCINMILAKSCCGDE
jgi:hypothetical protein